MRFYIVLKGQDGAADTKLAFRFWWKANVGIYAQDKGAMNMARICIVEDEEKIRTELAVFLERNGYECVCAESFEDVPGYIQSCEPDLVLLDLNLPGMDGYSICRAVKAHTIILAQTRRFTNRKIWDFSTKTTRKVNGLERKKRKTPQKFIPPAFCRFRKRDPFPANISLKSSIRGITCWFISHQESVFSPKGNKPKAAKIAANIPAVHIGARKQGDMELLVRFVFNAHCVMQFLPFCWFLQRRKYFLSTISFGYFCRSNTVVLNRCFDRRWFHFLEFLRNFVWLPQRLYFL